MDCLFTVSYTHLDVYKRQAYMVYIYNYLSSSEVGIINEKNIDTASDTYNAWKKDEISLRDYLYRGIADGWLSLIHI